MKCIRIAAAILVVLFSGAGADAAGNVTGRQVLTAADLQNLIASAQLTASGGPCPASSPMVVSLAAIQGCVKTSGCANNGSIPVWQTIVNCRTVVGSTHIVVSGTAFGATTAQPAVPALTLTSTSTGTVNPNSTANQIVFLVTGTQVTGNCSVQLLHGGVVVVPPATVSLNVATTGVYFGGVGGGVYTLEVDSTSPNSSCTVNGSLPQ
jgi:hypothetical protein